MTIFLKITKPLSHLCRFESGNAAVEFALILPLLLLFTIPTLDFGVVAYNQVKLRSAISTGVISSMDVTSLASKVKSNIENATSLKNTTVNVTKFCQCSDNSSISCASTCGDGSKPDTYYRILVNATVDLTGTYGFVDDPFPISEDLIVMVP